MIIKVGLLRIILMWLKVFCLFTILLVCKNNKWWEKRERERENEKYDYRTHFAAHLLGTETYHDYLERRLDNFNNWLMRDRTAVEKHLENWLVKRYLQRGFSPEIRPVSYDEFMGTLYHAKARDLNRIVCDFKKSVLNGVWNNIPFERMDHLAIFTTLKLIFDFHSDSHKLKDIDDCLMKYGLV